MSPKSHPRIPGLEIIDLIGEGGQASIHRAHQPSHDRVVAVRIIRAPWIDDDVIRRFDRERQALGRISDHPGIVSLLESGRAEDGCPYLVLEYCPGGSLADHLAGGPLSADEATSIALLLANALETAHRADVLHRDVKPENILCSSYGHWQLGDFGVAGLLDVGGGMSSTVRVSFAHAAPESFDGGEPTPACDVYSLASTLFTMLTAMEPMAAIDGEARASAVRRVISDPRPDPRDVGIAEPLARLIETALALDPADRPASAALFAAELREARQLLGFAPGPVTTGMVDAVRVGDGNRSRSATDGGGTTGDTVSNPGPPLPPGLQQVAADGSGGSRRRRSGARRWSKAAVALFTFLTLLVGGGALAAADVVDLDTIVDAAPDPFGLGPDGNGGGNGGGGGGGRGPRN